MDPSSRGGARTVDSLLSLVKAREVVGAGARVPSSAGRWDDEGEPDHGRRGMDRERELGALARAIVDSNMYMVLGTADQTGRPWVSPVYYASAGYREFYWVSSPEALHSRNLGARPQVSIVIFDSRAPIGSGQGVYISAVAEELADDDLDRGIEIFSRVSQAHGARGWKPEDVRASAPLRLYRATAAEHWVRDPDAHPDRRTRVRP
jgi:nitroimidazol reductase NimA-like FMN-containing flavoprotein (pyridoxamine 5'-phosphate oxidase superfamily)